jgi:hypothetical protein
VRCAARREKCPSIELLIRPVQIRIVISVPMNPRVGWNGLISNATNGLGALLVDATTRQIILRTPTGSVTIFVS